MDADTAAGTGPEYQRPSPRGTPRRRSLNWHHKTAFFGVEGAEWGVS